MLPLSAPLPAAAPRPPDDPLMQKAKELEASFLAEMLGHVGLSQPMQAFNGGAGEEQFSSFLRMEQARAMVEKGGIGLAEVLFRALSAGRGTSHDG